MKVRNLSIDAVRLLGFFAVVLLHVVPKLNEETLGYALINHATRWAVPVYFLLSGYLFSQGSRTAFETWRKIAFRLASVYLFWVLIYYLANRLVFHRPEPGILHTIVRGGSGWHLWFIPSLLMSLTILIAMSRSSWSVKLLVAAGLFVAGLILGPYSVFSPLPRILADTRSGPFFGTIFVVAGACIARFEPRMNTEKWAFVAAAGLLLQIAEALLISFHSGRTLGGYDYLIGTVPFGIGMFMALKDLRYPSFMAWLGQSSLGMYCCHVLVLNVLATFVIGSGGFASSVAGVAVIVTAVSLMSVGVSVGLYRIPAFRRFVR